MRPLTSPFRKFRLSSSFASVTACAGIFVFLSCRVRDESTPTTATDGPAAAAQMPQLPFTTQGPTTLSFMVKGEGEVARLDYDRCKDSNAPERWNIRFNSPFGAHVVRVDFSGARTEEGTRVSIDGTTYRVSASPPWNTQELTAACSNAAATPDHIEVTRDSIEPIKNLLQSISPSCQFEFKDGAWLCQTSGQPLVAINAKLHEIRSSMMLRWSRHPYILTRRVALAVAIGDALGAPTAEQQTKEINRLCRVMARQLPAELPLAFRAEAVQNAVCLNPGANRVAAAQSALIDTLVELDTLRTKLETSSHLGTLTVKVPHNAGIHSRELWVSLSPISDEAGAEAQVTKPDAALTTCWHPIYSASSGMAKVALELGLVDRARASTCQVVSNVSKPQTSFDNYVLNSTTSETEFSVANGVPKLLRMPLGTYNYAIRVPLDRIEGLEQDTERPRATGTISWKSRRPTPAIIQW